MTQFYLARTLQQISMRWKGGGGDFDTQISPDHSEFPLELIIILYPVFLGTKSYIPSPKNLKRGSFWQIKFVGVKNHPPPPPIFTNTFIVFTYSIKLSNRIPTEAIHQAGTHNNQSIQYYIILPPNAPQVTTVHPFVMNQNTHRPPITHRSSSI